MHQRYRLAFTLAAVATVCACTAFAGPKTDRETGPVNTPVRVMMGTQRSESVQSTCQLGVLGPPVAFLNYLFPPNDQYFTYFDPNSCTPCATRGLELTFADLALRFPAVCSQPVQIAIYGTNGDVSCPRPDVTNPLCPPFIVTLTPPAPNLPNQYYNFQVPMPAGCCVNRPAFLMVNFLSSAPGCATSSTQPRLVIDGSCDPCTSYNFYLTFEDDLCTDAFLNGNPLFSVEGDCCNVVPNQKHSWGSLKLHYKG